MPYIQDKSRYAKPNDEVKVIKKWGDVWMCQVGDGECWPCHKDRLGEVPNVPVIPEKKEFNLFNQI